MGLMNTKLTSSVISLFQLEYSRRPSMDQSRRNLDLLFFIDANVSLVSGCLALLSPHGLVAWLSEFGYNHEVHETIRLYGCLKIAVGWILYRVREVDDGRFRRSVCEALCVCYALQSLAVARAQFTDRSTILNWIAIIILSLLCGMYALFRFGRGGNLIKIYELPSSNRDLI